MNIPRFFKFILVYAVILSGNVLPVSGWDWLDYVAGGLDDEAVAGSTLSLSEIGEMRVRDIKRRLTRVHGYGAEEVGRMLDKQDLINALAFEEHKAREKKLERQKRVLVKRGIIAAVVAVLVVLCWPLLAHAWEVAEVNFVVFKDRKRLEIQRCFELQSIPGFVGVLIMSILDVLQIWLTVSILLSWVTTSKYFFPVPSLPIHPAKFIGGQVSSGPLSRYGLNIGPMLVRWGMNFANGIVEKWTGKVLSSAQREQKRKARENETQQEKEDRKARKAARKAAKEAARGQAAEAMASRQQHYREPNSQPNQMDSPIFEPNKEKEPIRVDSTSIREFLGEEFDKVDVDDSCAKGEGEKIPVSSLDDLD